MMNFSGVYEDGAPILKRSRHHSTYRGQEIRTIEAYRKIKIDGKTQNMLVELYLAVDQEFYNTKDVYNAIEKEYGFYDPFTMKRDKP